MEKFTRSQHIGLFVVLAVILAVIAIAAVKSGSSAATSGITFHEAATSTLPASVTTARAVTPPITSPPSGQEATPPSPTAEIVVHVAGAVQKPGVYHLKPDARNEDALQAAGGPTAEANTDGVNLAAHIQDGTQLYIPTHKEQATGGVAETAISAPGGRSSASTAHNSATKPVEKGAKSGKITDPSQGQINLNTANAEQLQRIPGIGPAMAERVLAFRKEAGGFKTAEDLLQISGIGEKKFEKMRPYVKVH